MSTVMVERNLYGVFYKDGDKWRGPYQGDIYNKENAREAMSEAKHLKKKLRVFRLAWVKETKPRNPFTKFYREIAGCQSPKATDCEGNRYYTNAQITRAKKLMIGQYWEQKDLMEFAACNSKGKRRFFQYDYSLEDIKNGECGNREERLKASVVHQDAKKKAKAWSEKS